MAGCKGCATESTSSDNVMVPMAFLEATQARHAQTLRTLLICWTVSVVVLGFALLCSFSYTTETTDEYTTTTTSTSTSTDVGQEAGESGSNYFYNGDLVSDGNKADGQTDGQADSTNDQTNQN